MHISAVTNVHKDHTIMQLYEYSLKYRFYMFVILTIYDSYYYKVIYSFKYRLYMFVILTIYGYTIM